MTQDVVTWTLTEARDLMGQAALHATVYRAVASCPHGRTEHVLFGGRQKIERDRDALAVIHTMRQRCRCTMGRLDFA